ncbi:MAG TPA: 3'-5' exonuclease [Actinocrinis sp.]|nr:3'-5' exonuclease [Actinocrinis sp.]
MSQLSAHPASGGALNYAIVDVETSGFHPPGAEVVEIAIVHVDDGGRITGKWDSLIRPDGPVGPTRVHGIDEAMVREAPRFASVAPALHGLLAGRVVVAHNLSFDAKFLVAEFARAGIGSAEIRGGACTLSIARHAIPGPRHQLSDCCRHAGIRLTDAHTAMGDATATAHLAGYFLRRGIPLTGQVVQPYSLVPLQRDPIEKLLHPRIAPSGC